MPNSTIASIPSVAAAPIVQVVQTFPVDSVLRICSAHAIPVYSRVMPRLVLPVPSMSMMSSAPKRNQKMEVSVQTRWEKLVDSVRSSAAMRRFMQSHTAHVKAMECGTASMQRIYAIWKCAKSRGVLWVRGVTL